MLNKKLFYFGLCIFLIISTISLIGCKDDPKEEEKFNSIIVYQPDETEGSFTVTVNGSQATSANTQAKKGQRITLNATKAGEYVFVKFELGGGLSFETTDNPATFTMPDAAVTISAVFSITLRNITVNQPSATEGSFTVSVSGGTPVNTSTLAPIDQEISLNALPASGYKFLRFELTGGLSTNITDNPGKFIMPSSNVTVTAVFEEIIYNIVVNQPPVTEGSFTISVAGKTAVNASTTATVGQIITLNASTTTGYFIQFAVSGGLSTNITNNPGSFVMPGADVAVTAQFESVLPGLTAAQWTSQITMGWNLGMTLEARHRQSRHSSNYNPPSSAPGFAPLTAPINQLDAANYNPSTVKAHIDFIKARGFNAIRIPVTWEKAADPNNNYTIRADWMARVKEVVNWAVANDMYIILNTHHDEYHYSGTPSNTNRVGGLFGFRNDFERDASLPIFNRIWEQIAETFKDYDYKLIFEGLNEPRVVGKTGSEGEWNGGSAGERAILNTYYQNFVNTVRASGGNNRFRVLLINTYAASRLAVAVNGLEIPNDTVPNRIAVSIHSYVPGAFALNGTTTTWSASDSSNAGTAQIHETIDNVYNRFVSQGVPALLGEFGAVDRNVNTNVLTNNEATRALWAEYYVRYAESKGVKCFYWDDGGNFKLFNRATNSFSNQYTQIVDALFKGIE